MLFQRLKEENQSLRTQVETLRQEISASSATNRTREEELRAEIKRLTEDGQRTARESRELSAQLVALQARSPEVG